MWFKVLEDRRQVPQQKFQGHSKPSVESTPPREQHLASALPKPDPDSNFNYKPTPYLIPYAPNPYLQASTNAVSVCIHMELKSAQSTMDLRCIYLFIYIYILADTVYRSNLGTRVYKRVWVKALSRPWPNLNPSSTPNLIRLTLALVRNYCPSNLSATLLTV